MAADVVAATVAADVIAVAVVVYTATTAFAPGQMNPGPGVLVSQLPPDLNYPSGPVSQLPPYMNYPLGPVS